MEKILYLECSSGISGDMTVAALLDAGADQKAVFRALESLPVQGFTAKVSRVTKSGLDACDFAVVLDAAHENHDHDMAYLHGSVHDHARGGAPDHGHDHGHGRDRAHGTAHDHEHGRAAADVSACDHAHGHRGMAEVTAIIEAADMTPRAKDVAIRMFAAVAEAEAIAHGTSVDQVHFHEVGAIDSIADVVAIATAFDSLGVDEVVVTELCEGKGFVRCQHGLIPVPAPAVVNIAARHGIPLRILDVQGELVTPTGAAAVAALRTADALPERFVVERVGVGSGKRAYDTPGMLRAMLVSPR